VVGLAARNTLGNLIAGLSLVLYRPVRVGDTVQLNSPKGLLTAAVERVTLGYTFLRDTEEKEVIVPNSVMASSVVIRLGHTESSPPPAQG
jgi:small-conductance mechanosensitive channel